MGVAMEISSNALLFLLIFGMSATVETTTLIEQMRNKKALAMGLLMQFLVMPLLGFICVLTLKDEVSLSQGMMVLIVTSSPGGSFSNWWCSLFNAELALSVAMTAMSTLLSVLLLPSNLLLYTHLTYGHDYDSNILKQVKWIKLFVSLCVVIAGILIGLYCSAQVRSKRFRRWSNRIGTFSGILLIMFSALLSSSNSSSTTSKTKLWDQEWPFYVVTLTPCITGLTLTTICSTFLKFKKTERVTLSVECCYQNVGIATTAAVGMFIHSPQDRAEALCVPLFYGIIEALVLGIYCIFCWKSGWTKAPSSEKFLVMISKSYEIGTDDEISDDVEKKTLPEKTDGESMHIDMKTTAPDPNLEINKLKKKYDISEMDKKLIDSCLTFGINVSPVQASSIITSLSEVTAASSDKTNDEIVDLTLLRSRTTTEETHVVSVSSSSSDGACSLSDDTFVNHRSRLNTDGSNDLSKFTIDEMNEV